MNKIPFRQLPIYKTLRGSKLSKRAQDEVLKKLKRYYQQKLNGFNGSADNLAECLAWSPSAEGEPYWRQMHVDSGL